MKNTLVIGIAGGSASGKTTFTNQLKNAFPEKSCLVIPMDSYYKPEEQLPRSEAPITGKVYADFNCPLSLNLAELKSDLEDAISNGEYQLIMIEGLFSLWDRDIRERLDLKLFVECKADERIVRRLKRNMEWKQTFDQISEVYLDLVRYRHDEYVEHTKWYADFILNGSNPSDKALEIIIGFINSFLMK